jgi:hypothetical protein
MKLQTFLVSLLIIILSGLLFLAAELLERECERVTYLEKQVTILWQEKTERDFREMFLHMPDGSMVYFGDGSWTSECPAREILTFEIEQPSGSAKTVFDLIVAWQTNQTQQGDSDVIIP